MAAFAYTLVRLSVVVALAPFFTSRALPVRTRAVFVLAVCFLLVPVTAGVASSGPAREITFPGLLGEVAVGAIYGLTLSLFNEMLLLAGQIAGLQFSFSLVNLLDPASEIQTPLLGDLFQLFGTLLVITAGLDRILLASITRSLRAVPPGSFSLTAVPGMAKTLVPMLSGSFFAAMELAAPVLAATMLVEIAVALLGKLSPQLPVISLTVPLKTLTGFMLLIGALALWPRFVESRFSALLDAAEQMLAHGVRG
ncbi:MAG TPA: flagellar biosynthetic protein FliR [Acidobacteriaceae bacterium]|nr:flagellar biosynthetic protein FliR [Acidobacteriaceae bacterium]